MEYIRNFETAIKALNNTNQRVPYAYFTSEEIFDYVVNMMLKLFPDRKSKRERFISLMKRSKKMPGVKERYSDLQIRDYFKKFVFGQSLVYEHQKDYFLMRTDKLPFERM